MAETQFNLGQGLGEGGSSAMFLKKGSEEKEYFISGTCHKTTISGPLETQRESRLQKDLNTVVRV